jgi:archaetidylinositol phosphate synthase
MVLNQIRARMRPFMDSVGRALGNAGVSPNVLTTLGFFFALLAGFLFAYAPHREYLAGISIIGSGILDILDGAVARTTGKVTLLGSFNDSTLDRISEIAIFAGIAYSGYGLNPAIVLLALAFSLLVSYARAKGESLSFQISGIGIGERAERLIVLIVFALAGYLWIGIYAVLVLAVVTFIQRYSHLVKAIRSKDR